MSRAEQWDEQQAGRRAEDDGAEGPATAEVSAAPAPDPAADRADAAQNAEPDGAEAVTSQDPEVVLHAIIVDEDAVDDGAGGAWCIGASSAR